MRKSIYAGVFLISLSMLMYEILLTRIFSVTMYFHFAFVAISVVMFGLTVGSLIVYSWPSRFSSNKIETALPFYAFWSAAAMALSFVLYLRIPFAPVINAANLVRLGMIYIILAVPFVLSGIVLAAVFTRHSKDFSRLYTVDLLGAGAGALCLIPLLNRVDAVSAVFVVASLAFVAAFFFSTAAEAKKWRALSLVLTILTLGSGLWNAMAFETEQPLFRLLWVKGNLEKKPLYEKWNHFSRITVTGDLDGNTAFNYGPSPRSPQAQNEERWLFIDSGAGTPIAHYDGDPSHIEYLKYDVVNIAHHLRPDSRVMVVGVGGGRDVLTALAFGQAAVTGVEINPTILKTVNGKFGDFGGHLDKNPKVNLVAGEARSFVTRTKERFDLIQLSFIDTNSATAAGAYVFTEHSLYTVEAWKTFLERLTERGILSVSRWYDADFSAEIYRMAVLAEAALKETGAFNARDHMLIVKNKQATGLMSMAAGNLMVSRKPFSAQDLDRLEAVCRAMDFQVVLSPRVCTDPAFDKIFSQKRNNFFRQFPLGISAPTDDRPFFFFMLKIDDIFSVGHLNSRILSMNVSGLLMLGGLLIVVLVLCVLCIAVPLFIFCREPETRHKGPLLFYAAFLGTGFMLIEISQMQRMMLFLGDPVYGLTVVLFTLLLSSGLGSFSVRHIDNSILKSALDRRFAGLIGVLSLFGFVTTPLLRGCQGSGDFARILLCMTILFASGYFMGMVFPLGIKAASADEKNSLIPWVWGINGAMSVLASVLSVLISLHLGIAAAYWVGFVAYCGAYLCVLRLKTNLSDG